MTDERPDARETVSLLLVDDEEGFRAVLAKRLARRRFRVTPASSGTEALVILRRADFDAAVLDPKLEDMDGLELLRTLRRMVPEMPVLILTGHGSEEVGAEGIRQGAHCCLTKPCELDELVEKIREAVRQGGEPWTS